MNPHFGYIYCLCAEREKGLSLSFPSLLHFLPFPQVRIPGPTEGLLYDREERGGKLCQRQLTPPSFACGIRGIRAPSVSVWIIILNHRLEIQDHKATVKKWQLCWISAKNSCRESFHASVSSGSLPDLQAKFHRHLSTHSFTHTCS